MAGRSAYRGEAMAALSMRHLCKAAGSSFAAALLLVLPAVAGAQNKCAAGKLKCAAASASALLKCHAVAEKKGTPVNPLCLQKARAKLINELTPEKGCFEELEAKGGCVSQDDAALVASWSGDFVNDVVTQLDPGYPIPARNACSAAKKLCVEKQAKTFLACAAKAAGRGVAVDQGCVTKATMKFEDPAKGCFARAESKPLCLTTGDASPIADRVSEFVGQVMLQLAGCRALDEAGFASLEASDAVVAQLRETAGGRGYGSLLEAYACVASEPAPAGVLARLANSSGESITLLHSPDADDLFWGSLLLESGDDSLLLIAPGGGGLQIVVVDGAISSVHPVSSPAEVSVMDVSGRLSPRGTLAGDVCDSFFLGQYLPCVATELARRTGDILDRVEGLDDCNTIAEIIAAAVATRGLSLRQQILLGSAYGASLWHVARSCLDAVTPSEPASACPDGWFKTTHVDCDDDAVCTTSDRCYGSRCAGDPSVDGVRCGDATDCRDVPRCDGAGTCEPGPAFTCQGCSLGYCGPTGFCRICAGDLCDEEVEGCLFCGDGLCVANEAVARSAVCCETDCSITCAPPLCQTDLDCNPGAGAADGFDSDTDCLWATCRPGQPGADASGCVAGADFEIVGSGCEDGDQWACTGSCSMGGSCQAARNDLACNGGAPQSNDSDADCRWNVCNPGDSRRDADGCVANGGFEHVGSPCDDVFACTTGVCGVDANNFPGLCKITGHNELCNSAPQNNDPDADCRWNVCNPNAAGHDTAGCVPNAGGEAAGSPCSDGFACTTEVCGVDANNFPGLCKITGHNELCNSAPQNNDPDADCRWNVCNPNAAGHDTAGCVPNAGGEAAGSPCSDGFACTTEVCGVDANNFPGLCKITGHNELCNSASQDNDPDADCLWNVCNPNAAGHNAAGCAADGAVEGIGSPCADQNPCTTDDSCGFFGSPPFRRCTGSPLPDCP